MKSTKGKIAGVTAAAAALIGGGAAIAADRLSPTQESDAVVADAAKQLGVDPSKLDAALKQALENRVDAAVAAGRLTKTQGAELKVRIAAGDVPLVGIGPGRGFHREGRNFADLDAAASYLGVTEAALKTSLNDGSTLADIAKEKGKSVDGLKAALVASAKADLARAVKDGRLTEAQQRDILADLSARIDGLVNGELRSVRNTARAASPRRASAGGRRLTAPTAPARLPPGRGGRTLFPERKTMPMFFKNPRTKLAAAMTSAALIGAAGAAAVYAGFGGGGTTIPQVTVNSDAQPAANSTTSSISDIYKRSYQSVVEITVSSAASDTPFGNGGTGGTGLRLRLRRPGPRDHEPARRRRRPAVKVTSGTARPTTRHSSEPTLPRTSPSWTSTYRPPCSSRSRSATRPRSRSVTASSRSAARSGSRRRSRAGSSARSTARSPHRTTSQSTTRSRRTPRSTTATPAARCST